VDAFRRLKEQVPYIASYSGGRPVAKDDGAASQYDSMHYLTFRSQEKVGLYARHKAHQRFIREDKVIWAAVFVLNAVIDE
jgi:hypothetical protein